MSRTAQFAVNAAANYARMLVTIVSVAVLTPYIIARIGDDDFGLWTLVISTLGFLSLLDLGFGTGVVKYVAQCAATGNVDRRNRVLSTLSLVYLIVSLASVVCVIALALLFNGMFSIPAAQQAKSTALLWILAVRFVLLALPLSIFRNALYGEQKVYLINALQIAATVLYALGTWAALVKGYGVVALAWVNLAAMLVEYFGYVACAYAQMPSLRISYRLVDRSILKEVAAFSSAQFLINIAALILLRTDPIIVKAFLPLSGVAIYGVALKISENAYLLAKQFTNLLGPLAAQLKERAEEQKIRFLFVNCTKFAMAPSVMLTVAMYAFGKETLVYWVGPDFAAGGVVLMVLLTAMALGMAELTSSAVLSMTGHHRATAWAAGAEVVLNVGLSILLAKPLGLAGIAVGTLASGILVDMGYTIRRTCDLHGVTYISYVMRALAPALLPGLVQYAVTVALKNLSPPTGLLSIGVLSMPGVLLYVVIFWFFSIERSEKDLLISKLLRRLRPARLATGV
jgi:O-antigen/teichoic acid export membrane protein